MKPTYLIFYKNDECLEKLLSDITQFRFDSYKRNDNCIEWEHYKLITVKCNDCNKILQGCGTRVWGIFIEESLYNEVNNKYPEYIQDVLEPMLVAYNDLGFGIKVIKS